MSEFQHVIEILKKSKRGKEKFNISELARIFNITPETLRRYEKKKIIEPQRQENSYRVYSSWEITKIIRARQLRMEGSSLEYVNKNLFVVEWMQDIERIENRENELMEEIESRQMLLSWLKERKTTIRKFVDRKDDISIEKVEKIYCCIYMVGNTLTDKDSERLKELQKWLDALPYVSVYYIGTSNYITVSVVGITESQRKQYHLEYLVPDFILPDAFYLIHNDNAQHNVSFDTSNESIDRWYNLVRGLNYQAEDLYVIKMIDYFQRDGVYTSYNEMMMPLK